MHAAGETMVACAARTARGGGGRSLRADLFSPRQVLVLVIFFCHIQAVDPRCIYYVQNDLFLWNMRFLGDFLAVPGGPVEWLGRLVLQACHFGWPGAAILAVVAWLVSVATVEFLRSLSWTVWAATANSFEGLKSDTSREFRFRGMIDEFAWAMPVLVLLVVHGRYGYPLGSSIGAALAMAAAVGHAWAGAKGPACRLAGFLGQCVAIYYLAGNALYLFALCVLIYDFYTRAGGWTEKLGMVGGVAVAKLGVNAVLAAFHPGLLYFHIPSRSFFENELSLDAATGVLYASFALSALLVGDWSARAHVAPQGARGAEDAGPERTGDSHQRQETAGAGLGVEEVREVNASFKEASPRRTTVTRAILLIVVAVGASQVALRRGERAVLRLHSSADQQKWGEVLRLAEHVPPAAYSQFVRHDVNHALYQTGRLPWEMFFYPQASEPFVTAAGDDPYGLRRRRIADFLLRLGRANDAEFFVHEDFVRRPSAEDLRLMARIAMVKDRPDMARLFLNVLRDDLIYGAWAQDALQRLQEDPTLSQDAEIATLRAGMISDDDLHYSAPRPITTILTVTPPEQMPATLRRDPPNRMAFEFLMARYLAMRDVETVVRLLPQAAAFGYPATPPLYEEAAIIFATTGKEKLDTSRPEVVINGCRISQQTLSKVRQLDAATGSGRADPADISRVAGDLGLSYFRYYYRQDDGI